MKALLYTILCALFLIASCYLIVKRQDTAAIYTLLLAIFWQNNANTEEIKNHD